MRFTADGDLVGLPEVEQGNPEPPSGGGPVKIVPFSLPPALREAHEGSIAANEDLERKIKARKRLEETCGLALAGKLSPDYVPENGIPKKLNERAIQVVLEHAFGQSTLEIATRYDLHPYYVNRLCNHPDALIIASLVLGAQADKMTDMASRIESLAPEALTIKTQIMRDSQDARLRDKIASDILSMSGYGERKKLEAVVEHKHSIVMPAQAATGIREALDEARRVRVVDYRKHLAPVAGDGLQPGKAIPHGSGQSETASPGNGVLPGALLQEGAA